MVVLAFHTLWSLTQGFDSILQQPINPQISPQPACRAYLVVALERSRKSAERIQPPYSKSLCLDWVEVRCP